MAFNLVYGMQNRRPNQVLLHAPRGRHRHPLLQNLESAQENHRKNFIAARRRSAAQRYASVQRDIAQKRAARARAELSRSEPPLPKYIPPTEEQRSVERAIPRRIVQSWCNRNLTPGIEELCNTHRNCNPGYEYVFYDDKECRDFIEEHFHENVLLAYDALIPGAFKADLFRYCELYINGGWWFDIDMMSVGSIDAFVGTEIEFACPRDAAGRDDAPALYQALLGASKGNSVLERAIRQVAHTVAHFSNSEKTDALAHTGPKLLARCAAEVIPGCSARQGRNAWTDTRTAVFGESRMRDGFCILDGGVICIGHRVDQHTPAQAKIQRLYTALRRSPGSEAAPDYRASESCISLSAPRPSVAGQWELRRRATEALLAIGRPTKPDHA